MVTTRVDAEQPRQRVYAGLRIRSTRLGRAELLYALKALDVLQGVVEVRPHPPSPAASAGGNGFAEALYGYSAMRHSAADVLPSFVIRPALRSDWSR